MTRPVRTVWHLADATDDSAPEIYRSSVRDLFDVELAPFEPGAFVNSVESFQLGEGIISRCRSVEQTFIRTRGALAKTGAEQVQIILNRKGTTRFVSEQRSTVQPPGSIRLVDMNETFKTHCTAFDTLNLLIPAKALGAAWANRELHGLVLDPERSGTRMLKAHIIALYENAAGFSPEDAAAAISAAGLLLCSAMGDPATHPLQPGRPLLRRARAFIEANLAGELSPALVAAELGVSVRTAQRIFDGQGGVATYILNTRLDRAFSLLTLTARADDALASIALDVGFQSESHFSRAFLGRFGVRPGELRARQRDAHRPGAMSAPPEFEGIAAMLAWIAAL